MIISYPDALIDLYMDENLRLLDILERGYSLRILIILLHERQLSRTQLYTELGTGPKVPMERVNQLVTAGLVHEDIELVRPFTHTLSLTDKGRAVAELPERMLSTIA